MSAHKHLCVCICRVVEARLRAEVLSPCIQQHTFQCSNLLLKVGSHMVTPNTWLFMCACRCFLVHAGLGRAPACPHSSKRAGSVGQPPAQPPAPLCAHLCVARVHPQARPLWEAVCWTACCPRTLSCPRCPSWPPPCCPTWQAWQLTRPEMPLFAPRLAGAHARALLAHRQSALACFRCMQPACQMAVRGRPWN